MERHLGRRRYDVVSILLAFWIDAWWRGRQDRSGESVILRSLLGELEDLDPKLQDNSIYLNAIRGSVRKPLQASARSDTALDDRELDCLISDILHFLAPIDVEVPVLESLIGTEDLSTICNDTLRRELATLMVESGGFRHAMEDDFNILGDEFSPYLTRHGLLYWNQYKDLFAKEYQDHVDMLITTTDESSN